MKKALARDRKVIRQFVKVSSLLIELLYHVYRISNGPATWPVLANQIALCQKLAIGRIIKGNIL